MSVLKFVLGIIKKSLVDFYEYLFKIVFVNLICFTILILPFIFLYIFEDFWLLFVLLIISYLLAGPLFLSALNLLKAVIDREDPSVKVLFSGIKVFFKRGLQGWLLSSLIYLILLVDIYFFLQRSGNLLMFIIAVLFFYLLIFFSMSQLYFWGLLMLNPQQKLWIVFKKSLLLTLDNLLTSFLILVIVLVLTVILFVTGVGLPIAFLGIISLVIINLTRAIMDKYLKKE